MIVSDALLDILPVPILVVSTNTDQVLHLNPASADLYGVDAAMAGHVGTTDIFTDLADYQRILKFLSSNERLEKLELLMRTMRGELRWVVTSVCKVRYEDQDAYLFVQTDISAYKKNDPDSPPGVLTDLRYPSTGVNLSATLNRDEIFDKVLSNIGKVIPHDAVSICLIDGAQVVFVRAHGYLARGLSDEFICKIRMPLRKIPTMLAMRESHEPLLIPDTRSSSLWKKLHDWDWVQSYLGMPIIIKEKTIGFLNLDSATACHFTPIHVELLHSFGAQVSAAIENALLYEEAQRELQERKQTQKELRQANRRLQQQLMEIEQLQTQLREQVIRDPLTRLFNRRYLEETLSRELARAEREHQPLSLIMIDIDHFKSVNDSYGHAAGDRMLQALGTLLLNQTRYADVTCRYGGEEFCILMPGAMLEVAVARAEKIRLLFVTQIIEFGPLLLTASLSLGVACYPQHASADRSLISAADRALYQAKQAGRNRVCVSSLNN